MQYVEDKEAHEFRSALFIHRRHQPQVEERHEEPMDISALGAAAKPVPRSKFPQAPAPSAPGPSQNRDVRQDRFERQLAGLQGEFTKFMAVYMQDRALQQQQLSGAIPQQLSMPSQQLMSMPSQQLMPQTQQPAHNNGQQRSNRQRRNRPNQNAQPPLPQLNSISIWIRARLFAIFDTKSATKSFSAAESSGKWLSRPTRPKIPPPFPGN